MRALGRPFIGLYGACSTMAESMLLGSCLVDVGICSRWLAVRPAIMMQLSGSIRFSTELGVQRPLSAQWTVTGAGAVAIAATGNGPRVTTATIGKVVDMGVKDPNNMGPAMAPAAVDTLFQHLQDLDRQPNYYDMIFTGDLGCIGKKLVIELLKEKGLDISSNL